MSSAGTVRPGRIRLDELLVAQGLASNRAEAARLILAGQVRLPGGLVAKAGRLVPPDTTVERVAPMPFVGRGGEKLEAALVALGVSVAGRVCLDVGASTGGFTDCLLQRGAARVYAVDVGRGQLDAKLRNDARVSVREKVNARSLSREHVPETVWLATIDVSFISLKLVLPAVVPLVEKNGFIVVLVKPQFEAGRSEVGKGGIVRSPEVRQRVVREVEDLGAALGLGLAGSIASPIRGAHGNEEFLLSFRVNSSQ